MQKQRFTSITFLFFNNWLERTFIHYKHQFAIFFLRPFFIKLKFFRRFKKKFRKLFKRRHLFFLFFCTPNFLIHEKPTNARMGKGKGLPGHWVYKAELHKPFVILGGIALIRFIKIYLYLKKYLQPFLYWRKQQLCV